MSVNLDPKQPSEIRRIRYIWSDFLGEATIATQETTSDDLTVVDSAIDPDDDQAIIFTISGGTDGEVATITQSIVSSAGDEENETFLIRIRVAEEPVSVSDLKENLSLWNDTTRDGLIASLGRAARLFCEGETKLIVVRRQFTEQFSSFSDIKIFNRPLISVDEVTYTAVDGATETYDGDWIWVEGYNRAVLNAAVVATLPTLHDDGVVTVTYTAGLAEGECPENIIQAIKMLVTHWFENRSGMMDDRMQEAPLGVKSLLNLDTRPTAY